MRSLRKVESQNLNLSPPLTTAKLVIITKKEGAKRPLFARRFAPSFSIGTKGAKRL